MNPVPDLSVCVLTCKNTDILLNFLRSLYDTAYPVAIETIVVDNGSQDESVDAITRFFPGIKLYENQIQESPTAAKNRALRIASGRYVSLWDHDIIVQPGCILRMIDFMDATPDIGISGPRVTALDGQQEPSSRAFHTLASLLIGNPYSWTLFRHSKWARDFLNPRERLDLTKEVDWILGYCLFIRREVMDDIGLLDEGFPYFFEELDFCWRAFKAGWHTYFVHNAEIIRCGPRRYSTMFDHDFAMLKDLKEKNVELFLEKGQVQKEFLDSAFRYLRKKWLGGKSIF